MADFRQFIPTRVLVDANDLLSSSQFGTILCVPSGLREVIRILLKEYGKRRTTFYTTLSEAGYTTPTDEEWDIMQDEIDDFLGDAIMSCEEIATAINNLSDSLSVVLQNQGDCGCSGSQNSGTFEEAPSQFIDNGANFPDGYTDRADYLDNKCDLIAYLLNNLDSSLENISFLNLAGLTASALISGLGLASLILVGVPFVNIIALAGILLVIWSAQGTLQSSMSEARAFIADFDDCLLFLAVDAEQAQQFVYDEINATDFTLEVTKDVLRNLFAIDALNILFEPKPSLNPPSGDCSSCGDCGYIRTFGEGPLYPGGEFDSEIGPTGFGRVELAAISQGCPTQTVELILNSVSTPLVTVIDYDYFDSSGAHQIGSIAVENFPHTFTDVRFSTVGTDWLVLTEQVGGRSFNMDINFSDT